MKWKRRLGKIIPSDLTFQSCQVKFQILTLIFFIAGLDSDGKF
jgi:hypothetical protein